METTVATADGHGLDATIYEPREGDEAGNGAGNGVGNGIAVQINSAVATPRRYYRPFAEFLAGQGFVVATYDYRAALLSDARAARAAPSSLLAWGGSDQPAVTHWLRRRYPDRAVALIGHSVGGQLIGLSPASRELAAVVIVASGHGYWRRIGDARKRWRRAFHLYVSGPLALAAFGYLPGFAVGGGVPKSAAHGREFLRFGRSPHYFCSEDGAALRPFNADIRAPLLQIMAEDDEVAAAGNELPVREYFPNARVEIERLRPEQFGLRGIGHFGFFRKSMPVEAWRGVAAWLEKACTSVGARQAERAAAK
jgi:predicted alpha/beta hydrolase